MSYCRWSSDDFQCDVYVYEDVRGGWTTHVADNRVRYAEPLPAPVAFPPPGHTDDEFLAWYERHQTVLDMVGQAERLPIGLPQAWDKKWREWWWRGRERGATPNRAVSFAYRMTRDQLDARPGPYPDGSNAQEDS